jgi:hypothetical protein
MEEVKMDLLTQTTTREDDQGAGPPSGITRAVPRFKEDLKSILDLASGDKPVMRCVCSRRMLTAFYGFGDASSAGFGSTMMRPRGIHGRFGLWGKDKEDKSSNYRELRNLVETVEEEAREGYLKDSKLWLFTDNSMAESCFFKGGSTSKLLHELILRLKKAEIQHGFILHMVHVAGTRMIEQGTDGLSRGSFLEGVLAGKDMLSFVVLSLSAIQRFPKVLDYIQSWLAPMVGEGALGLYEECHCWWDWSGNCAKCCLRVKPMDGIFCANFCESRGNLPACRKTWHAECYECLGQGKFPVRTTTDEEGNRWFRQDARADRINKGVRGAHASIPFQCEDCWFLNIEGQPRVSGLDDVYTMCIC